MKSLSNKHTAVKVLFFKNTYKSHFGLSLSDVFYLKEMFLLGGLLLNDSLGQEFSAIQAMVR
jgi:hypothetical protein